MATYCTIPDVRAALTPNGLADTGQTAATLDDWQIADAIDEAEGVINAYTRDYSIVTAELVLPDEDDPNNVDVWQVAPDPIRRWTRNIAAYLSALVFRKNKDLSADDPIRLRYTMTMQLLGDVRAGLTVLPLPPAEGTSGDKVAIYNQYEGKLFDLRDFNLGPDDEHVQVFIPGSTEYGCR